jgi:hypothetical protein
MQSQFLYLSNTILSLLKFVVDVNEVLPEILEIFLTTTDPNLCRPFSDGLSCLLVTSNSQDGHDVVG